MVTSNFQTVRFPALVTGVIGNLCALIIFWYKHGKLPSKMDWYPMILHHTNVSGACFTERKRAGQKSELFFDIFRIPATQE